jgi:hypothetical protein
MQMPISKRHRQTKENQTDVVRTSGMAVVAFTLGVFRNIDHDTLNMFTASPPEGKRFVSKIRFFSIRDHRVPEISLPCFPSAAAQAMPI